MKNKNVELVESVSKKIVAIGGGKNGRLHEDGTYSAYETEPMDAEIIRLTGKKRPNFLFIGHSKVSSIEEQESYFQTMKRIYGDRFGCECQDLKTDELNDMERAKAKIDWADIIYEGGGDTLAMIQLWRKTGFDQVLFDAWNQGKVMCGVSAGACCWFQSCNSDSCIIQNETESEYASVDCLGWFHAHFTPHCDEGARYESTKNQLKENGLVGLLLSNCSAIEIVDDQYQIIFSDSTEMEPYVLRAYWDGENYHEEKINNTNEYQKIEGLFRK